MRYFCIYFLIINIVNFILFGLDKFFSRKNMWRIREDILFFISFLGGMIGTIVGMFWFRHKTMKKKFIISNVVFLIIWIYIAYCYLRNN